MIEQDQAIVKYRKICKTFGENQVLKQVDFDLHKGERVAIIGPSGSGKTTMVRLLMTLERPTSGTIQVNNEYLWHQNIKGNLVPANEKHIRRIRGDITMVFQHFNLFPHMTILQNCIQAPITVQGIGKKEAIDRAMSMLEKVGIADKAEAYPANLSGGQQQRVAIARALVMRPKVMLFDEPTSALDPELVGEVLDVIKDIAKDREMAMMLITHEMQFAREVADRVCFFDEGKIQEEGPPEQIFNNPQTKRLQSFLNRINL